MEQRRAHPLDVDLLSDALGELDVDAAEHVTAHLGTCLLCRVRLARVRRAVGGWSEAGTTTAFPQPRVPSEVIKLLQTGSPPPAFAPGQLWLAGDDEQMLLWLRAVRADQVIAHPVSLDVEAADEWTLIVDPVPTLGMAVGVVTSIVGNVPRSALVKYVADLDVATEVSALRRAQAAGTLDHGFSVGTPLSGATDERIELRQLLADELAALGAPLEEEDADPDDADQALSATVGLFEVIAQNLPARRGRQCAVFRPSDGRVLSFALTCGWESVALVTELTCTILVVAVEAAADAEINEPAKAEKLIEIADATTLAIVDPREPHMALLFEVPDLKRAIEPPRGVVAGPRPRLQPLPVLDALFKYLEHTALVSELEAKPPATAPTVALNEVIILQTRAAIEALRSTSAQKEKRLALRGLSESDATAVAEAIRSAANADDLLVRIEGIVGR